MQHVIKFCLSSGIFLLFAFNSPSYSREINIKQLSQDIQNSLNTRRFAELDKLFSNAISKNLYKECVEFLEKFPNAKWRIEKGNQLKDKRHSIDLYINAEKQLGAKTFSLEAMQKIAITLSDKKIIQKEVINEYSILKSTDHPIDIDLSIPDYVLTGTTYNVDIILEKPLEDAIIAGGLITINEEDYQGKLIPNIPIVPLASGGLYKTVQAPLSPGTQKWAALIAHPKGLISITKTVRIVSDVSEINP
ncbi:MULTISPECIES: hypothetical protein [Prochlorococcus]|uniref:hypothetical protein n=1 Tax=Prochlorococcus TaxID=1218 RepID=UPI0005339FD0|nr:MULTISPECIES: hypothetical protein [Prochlorococcus]KGG13175.1 cyanobacterial hypothetical protein [Prochlorococcus sp. MIT 0601]